MIDDFFSPLQYIQEPSLLSLSLSLSILTMPPTRRPRRSLSSHPLPAWPPQCRKAPPYLWLEEDEINLLKSALDISKMSPEETHRSLFEVIEENLSVRYSREEIVRKLQYLQQWHTKVRDSNAAVVASHDQILFEIAQKVWGIEENPNESVVAENDEKPLTLSEDEKPLGLGLKLGFMGSGSCHMEVMMKEKVEKLEKFEDIKMVEKKEKSGLVEERELEIFLEGLDLAIETLAMIKKALWDK